MPCVFKTGDARPAGVEGVFGTELPGLAVDAAWGVAQERAVGVGVTQVGVLSGECPGDGAGFVGDAELQGVALLVAAKSDGVVGVVKSVLQAGGGLPFRAAAGKASLSAAIVAILVGGLRKSAVFGEGTQAGSAAGGGDGWRKLVGEIPAIADVGGFVVEGEASLFESPAELPAKQGINIGGGDVGDALVGVG